MVSDYENSDLVRIKRRTLTIIGGDSVIGKQLLIECENLGVMAQASTRRMERVGGSRFFLDLTASQPAEYLPKSRDTLLIVAAKTGFELCESDPTSATVNIDAPVLLAKAALASGRRVVFVSSSSVFGGDHPLCHEDDNLMPKASYTIQKAEAERQLRALPGWSSQGAIVRPTKVLAPNTSPIPAWRDAINRGETISPFSDMVFSPISLQFVAHSLLQIALSSHCGNFHLSGAADVTYEEFARHYVNAHNCAAKLVVPTTSIQAGIGLSFRRSYSALGMVRTQQLTHIAPQNMRDVVKDLLQAEQDLRVVY
jgi:dTDP-4-dehydrorhamnose reductase